MFIETRDTPNPATLMFRPGREVIGDGPGVDFPDAESAERSPLARRLFALQGVSGVYFGDEFLTVTVTGAEWQHLKPAVLGAIMEHFTSGAPLVEAPLTAAADNQAGAGQEDSEVVYLIKELLETRVRPAVAQDGGDIVFANFDEESGTVYLQMQGACAGCPSATMTLQHGVENLLRHYIPEVNRVEPV
ncbi:MAG: NifU family protein [Alphaproteobacteria bacterium]|nr:MAG: NifU family protein [Alphaproteobacteria bacterium]